ncbi:MAG: hypothetical protein AAGH90_03230 [Pseudomonadota bacterium]
MGARVLFQLFFFALPFIMFGLYRLAITEAEEEGRKPWPIRVLFGIGLLLGVGSWIFFIVIERVGDEPRRDLSNAGRPMTEDPGGQAEGVTRERERLSDATIIDEGTAERLNEPDPAGPDGANLVPTDNADVEPVEIDEDTAERLGTPER